MERRIIPYWWARYWVKRIFDYKIAGWFDIVVEGFDHDKKIMLSIVANFWAKSWGNWK